MLIIIPIVVVLLSIVFMILISGNGMGFIVNYLDIPSLVLLLIIIIPMLISSGLTKDFFRAFRMMKKGFVCSLSDLKKSLEAVDFVRKGLIYAGLMITMFTFVVILRVLSTPESLGPNIAVLIINIFYVSVLELILLPVHTQIKKMIIDYMEEE